tara:strand:+ start:3679 stop:6096 length:2418 start_codon:yes stop_codon:yes gene_type:complete
MNRSEPDQPGQAPRREPGKRLPFGAFLDADEPAQVRTPQPDPDPDPGPEPADSREAPAEASADVGGTGDDGDLPFGAVLGEDQPLVPPKRRRRAKKREPEPTYRDSAKADLLPATPAPTQPVERPAPVEAPDGRIVQWRGFTLQPFQIRAVDAVRAGHNVLVAAPTGAGKTLVAEYAIEDAVKNGQRCIYTSPVKALSSQKYRDFRDDPDVDIGLMTGDVTISPHAQVLIMTTEILRNAIFENPRLLDDVGYVIFDEVHYLDDRDRGTVWEESLIFLPPSVRLICLSATIQNVEELGSWLEKIRPQGLEVIQESARPVPLSHWMYAEKTGVFGPQRLDSIRKKAKEEFEREKRGSRTRGRRGGSRRGRRGAPASQKPDARGLLNELVEEDRLPALVFAFSRKDVEMLARKNGRRDLLSEEETRRMTDLQHELVELFQLNPVIHDSELFRNARNGVSYHHAGMLPVHKELVERMFTAGLLKMLFTTETFAIGINMPARTAVFHGLRKFDGISFDWIRTRDYMQMAGRAGRQGIDDKGYVYSLMGNRELAEAPMKRMFSGRPEPVMSRFNLSYSTILHLVENAGRERLFEAWESSFAQYQARSKNKKAAERQRRDQRREVQRRLDMLEQLDYLDGETVTTRGKIARLLTGYELQVCELLFSGLLENVAPRALAMIFTALIHEERSRGQGPYVPAKMFGDLRRQVSDRIGVLNQAEGHHGIEPLSKRPDWGLTPAVLAWYGGADMEEMEAVTEVPAGDICRVLRMTIQLMRNTRRAIDPSWDLAERLQEAVEALNRDEIDARRQLELG